MVLPFYPLLVSFRLQIAYKKLRNSRIGVNKLVGYVSINLLATLRKVYYVTQSQPPV